MNEGDPAKTLGTHSSQVVTRQRERNETRDEWKMIFRSRVDFIPDSRGDGFITASSGVVLMSFDLLSSIVCGIFLGSRQARI